MKNYFFRKIMSCISITLVIVSLIVTAYASSYTTSYSFSVWLNGWTRSFNGANIQFKSPNATSTPFKHPTNKT
jgi:hypothetical protein